MSDKVVASAEDLAAALAAGGVVRLMAGIYPALFLEASVTIQGEPGAVIDAGGRGSAVHVAADDLTVVLRGLTITGGHAEKGGGVRIDGASDVSLIDCGIQKNKPSQGGARGLGASGGRVRIERCTFGPGEDLVLTGLAEVQIVNGTVEAGVAVRDRAQVVLEGGVVGGVVHVRGTPSRKPRVTLRGVTLGSGVENDEDHPGEIIGG